ncbi:MAG: disulfide bond formation protein B [Methyloligellaceae bacterium]
MPFISNPQNNAVFLALISCMILAAAWGFEIIGGFKPCPLCLMQRYVYYLAIPAGIAAYLLYSSTNKIAAKWILAAIGVAFLANMVFGAYHSGIEWGWWEGPSTCAGSGTAGFAANPSDLLNKLQTERVVPCDEAAWRMFGISFAGYNAIFSLGLAILALGHWLAPKTR